MTTIDTITAQQIQALSDEAAVAGDPRTVEICARAVHALNDAPEVDDSREALRLVVRMIRDAEAQA